MNATVSKRLFAAAVLFTAVFAGPVAASAAARCDQPVTTYPPAGSGSPFGITAGPGGMWYADGDYVVQVRNNHQRAYNLPGTAGAGWLAWPGNSSSIWFADRAQGRIGTIDTHGYVQEYQIPPGVNGTALPHSFVFGPESYVWFTDQTNNRIGRLNLRTARFVFFTTPALTDPLGMTRGRDGALYFVERSADAIGRLAPDGTFTFTPLTAGSFPNRIVVGPDGNVWFTELYGEKLGRIDAAGTLTEYPFGGGPVGIVVGADDQLYVALWQAHKVVRVDTADGIVERAWRVPGALQVGAGLHGTIWATDPFAPSVARIHVACG